MGNLSSKYRPQRFSEIQGQERVIEPLRQEIARGMIGHAYLFSGPRGVGKTTAARVFAKAVNCEKPEDGEPCLTCSSCKRIGEGEAIDLVEMDAASWRRIDDIREAIIEHVRFLPASLKYKVYLLDEAHMLTMESWNALLKTIEEPPAHALFLFATTERHKVPETIASRCQRFHFSRISPERIQERLKEIAKKEKIVVSEDVLLRISQISDGCLRDAENILAQLMALGGKKVDGQVLKLLFPETQSSTASDLLLLGSERRLADVLERIADMEAGGSAFLPLFDDLIQAVRRLLLAGQLSEESEALQHGDVAEKALFALVGRLKERELLNLSLVFLERRKDAKQGLDARFALELAMTAFALGVTAPKEDQRSVPSTVSSVDQDPLSSVQKKSDVKKEEFIPMESVPKIEKVEKIKSEADPVLKEPEEEKVAPSDPVAQTHVDLSLEQVQKIWPAFLEALSSQTSLLMLLKMAEPVSLDGSILRIRFQYPFHQKSVLDQDKNRRAIEKLLQDKTGCGSLVIEGAGDVAQKLEGTPKNAGYSGNAQRIMETFGGEFVSVKKEDK